jgi:hypothetical protein
MNICKVFLRGQVNNMVRFLTDNVKFAKAGSKGIRFTNELVFGNIVKEMNEEVMREKYGVPVSKVCNWMQIEVYKNEEEYYDEDNDCYYACNVNDDRPYDMYKFKISTHDGIYFIIHKDFFKGEYFRNNTYETNKREFMNEFFDYYSDLRMCSAKDTLRLKDYSIVSFEVGVYNIPIDILEKWRKEYELSISAEYFDGETIVKFDRYMYASGEEEIKTTTYTEESDIFNYMTLLLNNKWVDLYSIERNLGMMLYDMKDHVPFKIDMEIDDREFPQPHLVNLIEGPRFKYNNYFSNIRNIVYSLANNEAKMQLVKLYMGVRDAHNDIFKGEKQYKLKSFIPNNTSIVDPF